jgi:NADH-quinone oxidoreductase subunit J
VRTGLFGLAGAGFLAVVQVLVYVGAVVTLFTFVVMLLNLGSDELDEVRPTQQRFAALILGSLFLGNLMAVVALLPNMTFGLGTPQVLSIENLARVVFGRHALSFELTSVLLLAAVIGVVALARRERAS